MYIAQTKLMFETVYSKDHLVEKTIKIHNKRHSCPVCIVALLDKAFMIGMKF